MVNVIITHDVYKRILTTEQTLRFPFNRNLVKWITLVIQQGFVVTLTETIPVEFDFDWSWSHRCHRFILSTSEAFRDDKAKIFQRTQPKKNGVFTTWRPPSVSRKLCICRCGMTLTQGMVRPCSKYVFVTGNDTDPSEKNVSARCLRFQLDHEDSVRVQTWGVLLVAEFLVILVVVNSVNGTKRYVTDTSATETCYLPSECSQSDIDDMEEEHDMETS